MAIRTFDELSAVINTVRNETTKNGNTRARIADLLQDMVDTFSTASLAFGGEMQLSSIEGNEAQFPEYKRAAGYGTGYFTLPDSAIGVRNFTLTASGRVSALTVTWIDDRHIGTIWRPATGTGTLVGNALDATVTYGAYSVHIVGTVVGNSFEGTITTTAHGCTEVHSCNVTTAASPSVQVGTYYSSFGDDLNDGLSLATPKRTLPAPVDGGVYYIERGSVFSGASDHIVDETKTFSVLDCGIGHRYVGNQLDVVTVWNDASGGAWSAIVNCHVGLDSNTGLSHVWEDGFPLKQASSLANCQATEGSYYAPTQITASAANLTVYVHPRGNGNPNSNGKVYEVAVRELFIGGRGSCRVEGVIARGATTPSGPVVFRSKATDGTDYPIARNNIYSQTTYHGGYMCGGLQEDCLALFCQPQGGSLSYWVFHRSVTDVVPVNWTQNNCAAIESPYRTRGTNETGYDWHPTAGTLGNITINKPYGEHVGGYFFFPSGNAGTVTINDALLERLSPTAPSIFIYNAFTVNRLRHFQGTDYAPGPKLLAGATTLTITDSLCVTPYGSDIPSNTFDGYITPDGGADEASRTYVSATRCTFKNVGTYSRRVAIYIAPSSGAHTKISFAWNNCIFSGFTSDVVFGDTSAGVGTRLASDHNTYGDGSGTWLFNNSIALTITQYRDGWYGTYTATDANSVQAASTFSGTAGRYPTYAQTSANPGGYTGQFVDVADYLGVAVTAALELAGRLAA
jgi:hypothetical protein